jgi:hypothetical protein
LAQRSFEEIDIFINRGADFPVAVGSADFSGFGFESFPERNSVGQYIGCPAGDIEGFIHL